MSWSRRTFLQQVGAATALGAIGPVRGKSLWASSPADLVREPEEALLRELALIAVDAARAAGATFADVGVAAGRFLSVGCFATYGPGGRAEMMWPALNTQAAYGIRAIVDGAWGFASAKELTADAVRETARHAVGRARANRPRRRRSLELAPVPPAERGTWATPIEQDPFRVPVGEQGDLALAALEEAGRVAGVDRATVSFEWSRNVRVFASSEGALLVQRQAVAVPGAGAVVYETPNTRYADAGVDALRAGPYGYEAVARVNLKEELRRAAERAVAKSRESFSTSPAEVGRYDLVFGAPAVATLLTVTVAEALNLERALGYHAIYRGLSFAAPPDEILGKFRVGSPLLTVRGDRTRAGGAATVGWDDEGVRASEFTLVRDGVIVDYLTNRQTAMELAAWYDSQGEPVRSRGCAYGTADQVPQIRFPNLTMAPGSEDLSVDDLIADTKRGFYLERCVANSDQQVLNTGGGPGAPVVREIRDGKLGRWIRDSGFQFITPGFWRTMDAIGGADSMAETLHSNFPTAYALQVPFASVRAVPIRVRGVNVLNYGSMA